MKANTQAVAPDRTIKAKHPWMKDFVLVKHPIDELAISQHESINKHKYPKNMSQRTFNKE
jgi:hypothetical protein